MVTHDPRSAARAQRVLHLDKGQLVDGVPAAAAGGTRELAAAAEGIVRSGDMGVQRHE